MASGIKISSPKFSFDCHIPCIPAIVSNRSEEREVILDIIGKGFQVHKKGSFRGIVVFFMPVILMILLVILMVFLMIFFIFMVFVVFIVRMFTFKFFPECC